MPCFSYDIDHEDGLGDITVVQDTFIHSFSPKDLNPLPKNIVFVIDVSGSMGGAYYVFFLEFKN